MDNKIFNVNGRTKQQLDLAIKCLLMDEYGKNQLVRAWYISEKSGFVLCWHKNENTDSKLFTDRMGNSKPIEIDELVDILWVWLHSAEASKIQLTEDEGHLNDSDVSEYLGWRLYTDSWGHVHNSDGYSIDSYSIAAFKPMWCWYGK